MCLKGEASLETQRFFMVLLQISNPLEIIKLHFNRQLFLCETPKDHTLFCKKVMSKKLEN